MIRIRTALRVAHCMWRASGLRTRFKDRGDNLRERRHLNLGFPGRSYCLSCGSSLAARNPPMPNAHEVPYTGYGAGTNTTIRHQQDVSGAKVRHTQFGAPSFVMA